MCVKSKRYSYLKLYIYIIIIAIKMFFNKFTDVRQPRESESKNSVYQHEIPYRSLDLCTRTCVRACVHTCMWNLMELTVTERKETMVSLGDLKELSHVHTRSMPSTGRQNPNTVSKNEAKRDSCGVASPYVARADTRCLYIRVSYRHPMSFADEKPSFKFNEFIYAV